MSLVKIKFEQDTDVPQSTIRRPSSVLSLLVSKVSLDIEQAIGVADRNGDQAIKKTVSVGRRRAYITHEDGIVVADWNVGQRHCDCWQEASVCYTKSRQSRACV